MKVIGIDPGITGAIAVVGDVYNVYDMPVIQASKSKKQLNAYELAEIIKKINPDKIFVEKVYAMPGQGVSSMFNFGKTVGIIEGVIATLKIPVEFVTPQKWKRWSELIGKEKDISRTYAIQKYPMFAEMLKRKKDIGRADAIHIAIYGLKTTA